uniref:Uncharacterized protein n=1 Tax=Candidatus Kentrum eta TaxID=2126337 RepID=A0A450V361_9GAMM|nr:MAG: hypothetical protein BECKH772B_GA0070898_101525 [Candidatus Kentron sp. H]
MYMGYLSSEPNSPGCCHLSEVMNISHDSANRFLHRETYSPQDLFKEATTGLNLKGGLLSVDDSVPDKPHSYKVAFVGYFWSGKHRRVVKGINLITLYYCDPDGRHQPVNYRVGHTKSPVRHYLRLRSIATLVLHGRAQKLLPSARESFQRCGRGKGTPLNYYN